MASRGQITWAGRRSCAGRRSGDAGGCGKLERAGHVRRAQLLLQQPRQDVLACFRYKWGRDFAGPAMQMLQVERFSNHHSRHEMGCRAFSHMMLRLRICCAQKLPCILAQHS